MGRMGTQDMLEHAPVNVALHWHLTSNHYPPHPTFMIPVAQAAIDKAKLGEWDAEIEMPAQVTYRGRTSAKVSEIVESMHLEDFITEWEHPEAGVIPMEEES